MSFTAEPTPCGVLFDVFKRFCGISHKELAALILSERPLSDGRSPVSRSFDRTWLSRFVVHAPAGSLQPRYFRDFGIAAQRVLDRIRSGSRGEISNVRVIDMIRGDAGKSMEYALGACSQDVKMYRNALERFSNGAGYTAGERAETVMVLFISVGCTANVRAAVAYTTEYVRVVLGGAMGTPREVDLGDVTEPSASAASVLSLGLMRVSDGYISGNPHWIDPAGEGAILGSMAMGERDIADVEADVSAEHARVWCKDGTWQAMDLGSTNGTVLVRVGAGEEIALMPDEPVAIGAGDELRLGAATSFMVVAGSVSTRG